MSSTHDSNMSRAIIPEELADRVGGLVQRHDESDVAQAARRIGVREAELRAIVDATTDSPSVTVLSAIVRGYDVDAWWLISGDTGVPAPIGSLPVERQVDSLNLLSELGATLTFQRRMSASAARKGILGDGQPSV